MAIIKRLKDTLGNIIYPQTVTKAVYDDNNNVLDDVLNEKVNNTDYAKYNKAGIVLTNPWYGIRANESNGTLLGEPVSKANYDTKDNLFIISKGTLENVLAERLKPKEWVLKGTLTTDIKDVGVNVDLTDCTEIRVVGYTKATGTTQLRRGYFTAPSINFLDSISTNGTRTIFAEFYSDGEYLIYRHGYYGSTTGGTWASTLTGFTIGNTILANTKIIGFPTPSVITECNIEIYAR